MKRSEMLKLIEGLFELAPRFPNQINAENLLSHLEQRGMLPPFTMKNHKSEYENSIQKEVEDYPENFFSWESEDGETDG